MRTFPLPNDNSLPNHKEWLKSLPAMLAVWSALVVGVALLALNVYGLTRDLRPIGLHPEALRFGESDLTLSKADLLGALDEKPGESALEYAKRVTYAISRGIAHIHWLRYDPDRFHQRVPLWENYILWAVPLISDNPEFERYHFSSTRKSIERGIGICGDASILLSQTLSERGIDNRIITMRGHVVVSAMADGEGLYLDPDFGVVHQEPLGDIKRDPQQLLQAYAAHDRYDRSVSGFVHALAERHQEWDGPADMIRKKYYFEHVAYFLKWTVPLVLLLPCVVLFARSRAQPTG